MGQGANRGRMKEDFLFGASDHSSVATVSSDQTCFHLFYIIVAHSLHDFFFFCFMFTIFMQRVLESFPAAYALDESPGPFEHLEGFGTLLKGSTLKVYLAPDLLPIILPTLSAVIEPKTLCF